MVFDARLTVDSLFKTALLHARVQKPRLSSNKPARCCCGSVCGALIFLWHEAWHTCRRPHYFRVHVFQICQKVSFFFPFFNMCNVFFLTLSIHSPDICIKKIYIPTRQHLLMCPKSLSHWARSNILNQLQYTRQLDLLPTILTTEKRKFAPKASQAGPSR